jgi:hypothetical protein
MMDEIFGYKNFRNDIVWEYGKGIKSSSKKFISNHDSILFYVKSNAYTFSAPTAPYTVQQLARFKHVDEIGNFYYDTRRDKNGDKKKVKVRPKDGTPTGNVWYYSRVQGEERLGYPTQKPEALLDRIIKASSNPGDVVLDPFSGCATCVSVAHTLGRRWIGIDVSRTSCKLMTDRLRKIGYSIGESDIIDMPQTSSELKDMEPFEFQNWVVQQLGGRQVQKKTGDRGIDGRTFTGDPIQVKQSENVGTPVVRQVEHVKAKHGIDIELKTISEMI